MVPFSHDPNLLSHLQSLLNNPTNNIYLKQILEIAYFSSRDS